MNQILIVRYSERGSYYEIVDVDCNLRDLKNVCNVLSEILPGCSFSVIEHTCGNCKDFWPCTCDMPIKVCSICGETSRECRCG